MEQPQHQQQGNEVEGGVNGKGGGGLLCRQTQSSNSGNASSSRWTPTSEQIRILKELYYNNGVRSPSADQIQRISARLRQYGKIEGKNVFYWFQNHKARERQKKRFSSSTSSADLPIHHHHTKASSNGNIGSNWKTDDSTSTFHHKFPNTCPGGGMAVVVGQMGSYGYGSVTMEKSFRECSISAGGSTSVGGPIGQNFGWVGVEPYSSSPYYTLFDQLKAVNETEEEEEDHVNIESDQLETLPLFPMHNEDINGFCNIRPDPNGYYTGWYLPDESGSRASLELSLNSYAGRSPGAI